MACWSSTARRIASSTGVQDASGAPSISTRAGGQRDVTAHRGQQRRLAGPVRADQREHLPRRDLQVHPVDDAAAAEVDPDPAGGQHGVPDPRRRR